MVSDANSKTSPTGDGQVAAKSHKPGFRKLLVIFIAFWAVAILTILVVRYPVIVGLLMSGNNDRALLAVESAVIDGDSLAVTFMRGKPDEPTELYILSGVFRQADSSSNSSKENTIENGNVIFNGVAYEILHRANSTDSLAAGSLSAVEYTIDWASQEQGMIKLGQLGGSLVEHIKSGKAFLLVSNGENTFAAAALAY